MPDDYEPPRLVHAISRDRPPWSPNGAPVFPHQSSPGPGRTGAPFGLTGARSPASDASQAGSRADAPPRPLSAVERRNPDRILTGIPHLDRAFGKPRRGRLGIALTSANVLAGVKGVGKSRLGLLALARVAHDLGPDTEQRCLVASAEMPEELYADYADDMGIFERFPLARRNLLIKETKDFDEVVRFVDSHNVVLLLIDSLQRMGSKRVMGVPGSDGQVAYGSTLVANRCNGREKFKDKHQCASILISHANKEGDAAGRQGPQHDGDGIFNLEHYHPITGETLKPKRRMGYVRMLTEKNRFGEEHEPAHFKLTDDGFECVEPPLLLQHPAEELIAAAKEAKRR
jgi:predicted ATP-dependent serine protease